MTRLAAHQPQYLPWPGYFDKMARADLFVLLDTVQYKKNEWQNRNRIRTAEGWQWLTVPVHYRFPMSLRQVTIEEDQAWRRKHREALRTHYARALHRDAVLPALEAILERPHAGLAALNTDTITVLAALLGIGTPTILASTLEEIPDGPDDRLIALCRRFGCTTYLAGAGGHAYMDPLAWRRAGIAVEFQSYRTPPYRQVYGGFEPDLSVVDWLMNCGSEGAWRAEAAA